jgi:uncharacterized membrane protein YqgA involved in biofilm formation
LLPFVDYTETTERIFSTSIETINTVGNVLFTENVARFYQERKTYKTQICDSIRSGFSGDTTLANVKNMLDFDFAFYAAISHGMVAEMQHLIAQCQEMMNISDEEIENYRRARQEMDNRATVKGMSNVEIAEEVFEWEEKIRNAKKKLNLE